MSKRWLARGGQVDILLLCPRWGSEALSLEQLVAKATEAGYDGIELSLPDDERERGRSLESLARAGRPWVAQHWQTADRDFRAHRQAYLRRLRSLAAGRPLLVNAHTGKDYFTFEQNRALLEGAREIEAESGVRIVHETHRGRFSFAAHVTRGFLEALPWLRLALDVSHWCNVAESLLEDQPEAVALAVARTDHLHARVGFPEGPQVPDPRAPEWQPALEAHLAIWDRVVRAPRPGGAAPLAIVPEFGPAPYMPHLPFANTPLADQWEVNRHVMQQLRERYAAG
jgi:sugar phosphate isomerase/epimerase